MNNRIAKGAIFMIAALALSACGGVGDAPEAKTDSAVAVQQPAAGGATFTIDTSRSKINWKAAKVSLAHDGGFRNFNGTVTVENNQVTNVKINIDATSIWSDNDNLTNHLKSPDFFAVEQFSTATFEASQFTPADTVGATHMITGNLTMHGQTNSVTFPATIQVGADAVTAKADFIINRKNWGIVYTGKPDDLINDEVRIIFDMTATKPAM